VDTGVDELRRQHKLRHVMLGNFGTGREFAVVREEVYTSMIQYRITKFEQAAAAKRAKQNKSKVDASADQSILSMSSGPTLLDKAQLLRNFKQYFVPAHWDVQVNSEYLLDVVYREHQTDPITGAPLFKQLQEAQVITVLIQADLLLRKVNNSSVQTVFWVRLPQMTPLLREMKKARQTIVSIVKRTQYKEIKLAALRAKRLNQSYMFTLLFHLKDMLGGNLLRVVATASGPVVRTVD
jgi:hypothetical protein